MDKQLFSQAITKYLAGVVLVGVLIFLPAGTLNFRNGWILMAILFVPMFCAGMVMLYKSPDLLRKRLNAKEKEMEQKTVVALSGLMFLAAFILAGLNYRFRWTTLPDAVIYISAGLFLLLCPVCRSDERKRLSVQNDRGTGRSDGRRYGTVWYRASSDVCRNSAAVSVDAAGTGVASFLCGYAGIYPDHRQKDPQRGRGTGRGPEGI